jgi:putative hydrolase of the HAD superfamily
MRRHYRHLLFDLDRTLWHFDLNSAETLKEIVVKFDLEKRHQFNPSIFIETYSAINAVMWRAYGFGELSKEELRTQRFEVTFERMGIKDKALTKQVGEYYVEHCPKKKGLLPYAAEVLKELHQRYELHILTNGFIESQRHKLKAAGIGQLFRSLITSSDSGYKKPAPGMFYWALQQLSAKTDEVVMIGDDLLVDIQGAANMGIDQVYFNPEKRAHDQSVTYEITCLSELVELL